MKSFFQFLSESAAQQAARLGLEGDGHGLLGMTEAPKNL